MRIKPATLAAVLFFFLPACRDVSFPERPLAPETALPAGSSVYDLDGDGQADCTFRADQTGRVTRLEFAGEDPGAVALDEIPFDQCRHLVLILDGFDYQLVRAFRQEGHFRAFHPPSKLLAPYPTMTDLCLADALGTGPARAVEALYYDAALDRTAGGKGDYLAGKNSPYEHLLDYRGAMLWDAVAYVAPWTVFRKEVRGAKQKFDGLDAKEVLAYFVASAGVGTREGEAGQRKCLVLIDRLANQVLVESRGRVKITLFSDHGHSYTQSKRVDFARHLKEAGWNWTSQLRGERDVVGLPFGLVTWAGFHTKAPAKLAEDLAKVPGVELASYIDKETVVVRHASGGVARIRRRQEGYRYDVASGDPLKLKALLAGLPGGADAYHDPDALLAATIDHEYPAPLQRLWRGHEGLVRYPPDVMVSLADDAYFGAGDLSSMVTVASTHGSLRRRNSVTFVMSTAAALPPMLRSRDLPRAMAKLTGDTWPAAKTRARHGP